MKRIFEMEESELLALEDDMVMKLIDYECALEGVPMLPPAPGPAPTTEAPAPDATAFTVAGVITLDSEHASRILSVLNSGQLYTEAYPRNDYSTKYLEPITDSSYSKPKIETKKVHSPTQWDSIKDSHTQYADKKAAWDKINKIYQEGLKERQKITENVWGQISEARDHAYDRERLREEFTRYLELAEGNRRIALSFLEKVKDLSGFPELKYEFCPEMASAQGA